MQSLVKRGLRTPSLHIIGSLDSVVEESRSAALATACGASAQTVLHPGGHFVPVGRDMVGVLVGWLRRVLAEEKAEEGQLDSVGDMDVPF
jgi:fermentation-respiration switch protein FrsA (DUF1100 family)